MGGGGIPGGGLGLYPLEGFGKGVGPFIPVADVHRAGHGRVNFHLLQVVHVDLGGRQAAVIYIPVDPREPAVVTPPTQHHVKDQLSRFGILPRQPLPCFSTLDGQSPLAWRQPLDAHGRQMPHRALERAQLPNRALVPFGVRFGPVRPDRRQDLPDAKSIHARRPGAGHGESDLDRQRMIGHAQALASAVLRQPALHQPRPGRQLRWGQIVGTVCRPGFGNPAQQIGNDGFQRIRRNRVRGV